MLFCVLRSTLNSACNFIAAPGLPGADMKFAASEPRAGDSDIVSSAPEPAPRLRAWLRFGGKTQANTPQRSLCSAQRTDGLCVLQSGEHQSVNFLPGALETKMRVRDVLTSLLRLCHPEEHPRASVEVLTQSPETETQRVLNLTALVRTK